MDINKFNPKDYDFYLSPSVVEDGGWPDHDKMYILARDLNRKWYIVFFNSKEDSKIIKIRDENYNLGWDNSVDKNCWKKVNFPYKKRKNIG